MEMSFVKQINKEVRFEKVSFFLSFALAFKGRRTKSQVPSAIVSGARLDLTLFFSAMNIYGMSMGLRIYKTQSNLATGTLH